MDTVEDLKGDPLLLTLHAVRENFQITHLIHNKESQNAKLVFDLYRERFDDDKLFVQFFEVILTDNGKEFSVLYCTFSSPLNCRENHAFRRGFYWVMNYHTHILIYDLIL